MASLPVTFGDIEALKVTFAVWNCFILHTSGNTAYIVYNMFTHELESEWGL